MKVLSETRGLALAFREMASEPLLPLSRVARRNDGGFRFSCAKIAGEAGISSVPTSASLSIECSS